MNFFRLFSRQPDPLEQALKDHQIDPQAFNALVASRLTDHWVRERRSDRSWLWIRRSGYILAALMGFMFFIASFSGKMGWKFVPSNDLVATVKVNGSIVSGGLASADQILPALKKAFESPNVKGVIVEIDSGGGAPVEADRIITLIRDLKAANPKPVVAVIDNLGASAALMIAVQTDRVYASKYSLVGSVGAVMAAWDVSKALERFDVKQRVYASGPLKAALSPFIPPTAAGDAKAQELVDIMGRKFLEDVHQVRGKRLKTGVDFGTGEVWDGETAVALGLIDELGTVETVAKQLCDTCKIHNFGPVASGSGLFGASMDAAAAALVRAVVDQSTVQVR